MQEDIKLVNRLKEGDESAMEDIMNLYRKKLYYFAYDLVGNREEAEDLAQEVFFKAYKSIHNFRGDSHLLTWLFRIAINRSIDYKRKKSHWILKNSEPVDEYPVINQLESPKNNVNPDKVLEDAEIERNVQKALDSLTSKERSAFVLKHYQDLKINEISKIMSLSDGTVKSLLHRAIQKLRKELSFYNVPFCTEEN